MGSVRSESLDAKDNQHIAHTNWKFSSPEALIDLQNLQHAQEEFEVQSMAVGSEAVLVTASMQMQ